MGYSWLGMKHRRNEYHDRRMRENAVLPRCHWCRPKGRSRKAKKPFNTEDDAWEYIKGHALHWLTAYQCPVCGKWHIGHEADSRETFL